MLGPSQGIEALEGCEHRAGPQLQGTVAVLAVAGDHDREGAVVVRDPVAVAARVRRNRR